MPPRRPPPRRRPLWRLSPPARRVAVAAAVAAAALAATTAGGVWCWRWWRSRPAAAAGVASAPPQEGRQRPNCQHRLSRAALGEAAALAVGYLLRAQLPDGPFVYERDWRNGAVSDEDSAVRQAGAAWGLGLATHAATAAGGGGRALAAAAAAGLAASASTAAAAAADAGAPGGAGGTAGAAPPRGALPAAATTAAAAVTALDWWAAHSAAAADGSTRWVAFPGDGVGSLGAVALVALAHVELLRSGVVTQVATVGRLGGTLGQYLAFLVAARQPNGVGFHSSYDPDSGVPSGDASPYYDGEALLALVKAAKYLGVTHRRRNTAYAAEGLVHAYAYAASADGAAAGLAPRARPIGCAVDAVLGRLTAWQHQLHAVLLALRYWAQD
ncbi:hypothetical protein I4F81_002387 [Pyropia yezoensis]|uniref:Uncharacterized protein n=1 Tax=Pyropia yezoensis TaxID=2788 RepID=A0ACC3BPE9_PYRYE|nr:hypothetical protein I4F81_002387 [Neopyropia yezoensis]